jgi:kumamolisin
MRTADAKETISVTIAVRRYPGGPPVPGTDYFLNTPPSQRRRMPPEEFAAKYGAAEDDLARVAAFAQSQGLTVVEAHAARRTVIVSGTVAQLSKAFCR